jgi:UDP-glucuronate 4-epimerase
MDYIAALESALDIKAQIQFLPLQSGDVPGTHADVQDLFDQFQYRPVTMVPEGIQKFVAWYREYFAH